MSRLPSQELPTMPKLPEIPKLADKDRKPTGSTGALMVSEGEENGGSLLDALGGSRESLVSRHESRTGVLLLLAIVVAAGGILYTMRRMGMSAQLETLDVKIDYPLDDSPGLNNEERERLLKELEESGRIIQVALQDLQMNPFAWEAAKQIAPEEDPEAAALAAAAERTRIAMEKRQREIEQAADKLEVRSIMGGRTPLANISGSIVRVGDVIDDMFEVIEIKTRTVLLKVDDKFIEIGELDEEE